MATSDGPVPRVFVKKPHRVTKDRPADLHHWWIPHTPEMVLADYTGRLGNGCWRYLKIECTLSSCGAMAIIRHGVVIGLLPPVPGDESSGDPGTGNLSASTDGA